MCVRGGWVGACVCGLGSNAFTQLQYYHPSLVPTRNHNTVYESLLPFAQHTNVSEQLCNTYMYVYVPCNLSVNGILNVIHNLGITKVCANLLCDDTALYHNLALSRQR